MSILFLISGILCIWLMWLWVYGGSLTNIKLYRLLKGGTWYRYFPKMYPYMSFWTQDKSTLHSHEIVDKIEIYD